MNQLYADVILPLSIPYTYTYIIPQNLEEQICLGKRVVVQFGNKKFYSAIVAKIHKQAPTEYDVKPIEYILDERPCVAAYQIQFWQWLSEYYMCKIGDVMNAALPGSLKVESTSSIQINNDFSIDKEIYDTLNDKEKKVIDILSSKKKIKIQELEKTIPKSSVPKTIKKLLETKIIFLSEEINEKFKPKLTAYLELNPELQEPQRMEALIHQLEKKAFKQLEALLQFISLSKKNSIIKKSSLSENVDSNIIKKLIDKKILLEHWIEESRIQSASAQQSVFELTSAQKKSIQEIKEQWQKYSTCLLYGEVGSGKTEIYIHLIQEQIHQNNQVLYLVPEIALTTQLIYRLQKVFGEQVYVYHSKFSENERTEIWNKVLNYEYDILDTEKQKKAAKIIVGPRSALFLPFQNLGLIIIDEEHENAFKQRQKQPYYNARDAAIYLAKMLNAKVLLGSATPSLETLYNCEVKKYGKIILKEKFGQANISRKIVDIRKYYHQIKDQTLLTPPLFDAIKKRLDKKEQVLIFHNRRGYVPIVQCTMCGWVSKCKNCDVSNVYHKQHQVLMCHYCGNIQDLIYQCPACGSTNINYKGWGTEKLEEEFTRLFPNHTIARLDQDTTRSKYAHQNIIESFEKHETDILIGTQMISKGLDFSNVTLVAIMNIDHLLYFPDFRAFEKSFQLLYQLSGRTGRLNKDGEVIVQTFNPEHFILQMYLENDYDKFYTHCINDRKNFQYPPYSKLYELIIKNKNENKAAQDAFTLYQWLQAHFKENILGPIKPYISKLNNYYLQQILIKLPKHKPYKSAHIIIQEGISKIQQNKSFIDVIVDA